MMTFVQDYRPMFMAVTFGLLGSAFYLTYRPRVSRAAKGSTASAVARGGRDKILTFNKIVLWAVTVTAVALLFFPKGLTGMLASSDQFTADMDRTVIRIEGMT